MKKIIITNASWEERYHLGMNRIINEKKPDSVLAFYLNSFSSLTLENREIVKKICIEEKVKFQDHNIKNKASYWNKARIFLEEFLSPNSEIYVDITTMPRELIWILFNLLSEKHSKINYIYNQPDGYNKNWLSRNHGNPRLVFKMSGIYELGKPTTLICLSGFDVDRIEHLIKFYEPKNIKIGIQTGKQFDNLERNYECHNEIASYYSDTELFEIDAFAPDRGLNTIEKQIESVEKESNIIIGSLGPKLTSTSIFTLYKKYPKIALTYIPSKEYNPEYSNGLGGCYEGSI